MKKNIFIVLAIALVIGVLAFVFKDSLFGDSKSINGQTYTLIPTAEPNSHVLDSIPADAFLVSYSVNTKKETDNFYIQLVQKMAKQILDMPEIKEESELEIKDLIAKINKFANSPSQDILNALLNMGLKTPSESYVYNVGLRPVLKMALADETKMQNTLAKSFSAKKLGTNTYFVYSLANFAQDILGNTDLEIKENILEELFLTFAVKDGYLNISVDSNYLKSDDLPIVLGFAQPAQTYDVAKLKSALSKQNLSYSSDVVWFDLKTMLNEFLAKTKDFAKISDLYKEQDYSNECLQEALASIQDFSTIVANTRIYADRNKTAFALDTQGSWQIDSKIALEKLTNMRGEFSKLDENAIFSFGLGINVGEMLNAVKTGVEELEKKEFKCEINNSKYKEAINEISANLYKINTLNGASWFTGFSGNLQEFDIQQGKLKAILSLDTNNYQAFASYIDMLSSAVSGSGMQVIQSGTSFTNLEDGKLEKLNSALIPPAKDFDMVKEISIMKNGNSLLIGINTADINITDKTQAFMAMTIKKDGIEQVIASLPQDLKKEFQSSWQAAGDYSSEFNIGKNGLIFNATQLINLDK